MYVVAIIIELDFSYIHCDTLYLVYIHEESVPSEAGKSKERDRVG